MSTSPQDEHKDNQDILDLKIEEVVENLLAPIDAIRSKTSGDGFLESRLNAFYRMMGFPVVNNALEYFSPGYDPELNKDSKARETHDLIISSIGGNKQFISQQLNNREAIFRDFSYIFNSGGFNAKAIALGSVYVRSFVSQFGATEPLVFDKSQVQTVYQRVRSLIEFYAVSIEETTALTALNSLNLLASNHPLKPFVVDPRVEIYPDTSIIAAPFLVDFSQLACFSNTSYKRPYIEHVISIRLNDQNNIKSSLSISKIIADIKKDDNVKDKVLLAISNNPEKELQNSDAAVFKNYFNFIRVIISKLVECTKEVADARNHINFQPIPDADKGMEGNITIDSVERNPNNREIEVNILDLYSKGALNSIANSYHLGLQGKVDEGNFVFSNIDDMVFSADKAAGISAQEHLEQLVEKRKAIAKPALDALKTIEYIMGEFSGLGLIDIIAIQSAFWLMDRDKLVGLIDSTAYARLKKHRPKLNVSGISRSEDVLESLKEFETKLKDVYLLIQLYFDSIYRGRYRGRF